MDTQYSDLIQQYSAKPPEYYHDARSELLNFVPDDAKLVLDVGCAGGDFGKRLKEEKGCVVWGIEPSEDAAKEAEKNLDKVVSSTFASDMPELDGQFFDAIFFNDVLEHLIDPKEALRIAKQYLRKSGYVIASIPNILYFPAIYMILKQQDWKYEDSGILDNTHLRFFTKKSVGRLFEESGYDIKCIEGINRYSYWKFNLLNFIFLNHMTDWRYLQFAVVAQPKP